MTETQKVIKIDEGSLISSLKQDTGYLSQLYNERLQKQKKQKAQKERQKNKEKEKELARKPVSRSGGIYVPPHKLRQLQQQILVSQSESSVEHQKLMWQLLRKSINGIINKVNIVNIQNVVIELFNQNIIRGKGLLARSIIKAQMASPNFTHVYTALIAVINTKFPDIVQLIISRVILQFQRAYMRNNKIVCMATTKMIAHLINQKVLQDYAGLQLLMITLQNPTEDSVDIACDFMTEVGQVLIQLNPAGATAVFERFKNILHEGQIAQKVQYSIQNLFAIRKAGFKDHPGVIPQLDLVEADDQITHTFDLQQELDGQQRLNIFKEDPFYQKTQQQWQQIKEEILGEDNLMQLKQMPEYQDEADEQQSQQNKIQDLSEKELINLRKVIYLTLQSSVNYQECAHKMLKMGISKGHQYQLSEMIIECNNMERIYQKFFGLLAQRFCQIDETFRENFAKCFKVFFLNVFKQQGNKIRNSAKFFAHLFYTKVLDWKAFRIIQLSQDVNIESTTSTAASRIFLKIMFRQIAENMGIEKLAQELNNPQTKSNYLGMFPCDHPNSLRYAINYWTAIGLGRLTDDLRKILEEQQMLVMQQIQNEQNQILKAQNQYFQKQKIKQEEAQQQALRYVQEKKKEKQKSSSSSSSSSGSSSSDSSSSDSQSDSQSESQSDHKRKQKRSNSRQRRPNKRQDSEQNQRQKEKERERQKQKQRQSRRTDKNEKAREDSRQKPRRYGQTKPRQNKRYEQQRQKGGNRQRRRSKDRSRQRRRQSNQRQRQKDRQYNRRR